MNMVIIISFTRPEAHENNFVLATFFAISEKNVFKKYLEYSSSYGIL